jgi:two-component system OmpR family response regulator
MKLLLIEDEVEIANFLIRGLKYEGYKIDHTIEGKEALNKIMQDSYDIIILDLRLPDMNGEEVLKKIRNQKNITPVIILTAMSDMEIKTKLLNAGADDYLVKPFSFAELLARIKALLRRSKNRVEPSETLAVGNLQLIPNMRMVKRKDKEIKLRLKEYSLLEYLMRNPDTVVTRNTLLENVWDYNARIFSNTIDSHVSSLRKKINEGFKDELIETIHGVGYILKSK